MDITTRKRIGRARAHQPWRQVVGLYLMMVSHCAIAFQPVSRLQQLQPLKTISPVAPTTTTARTITTARRMAAMDPNDLANLAAAASDHTNTHTQTVADVVSSWDAILSTLYATTVDHGLLKAAHGHSQPLFGPPDPYLSTSGGHWHSIPPDWKALEVSPPPATGTTATDVDQLPEIAKAAINKGYKVFDTSNFQSGGGHVLPGFKETGSLLPRHPPNIPTSSAYHKPEIWAAQKQEATRHYNWLTRVPMTAFVYVFIDFFFLRRDVDLYKEDIEENKLEVAAEVAAVTGVRVGVLALLGIVTVLLFGHLP